MTSPDRTHLHECHKISLPSWWSLRITGKLFIFFTGHDVLASDVIRSYSSNSNRTMLWEKREETGVFKDINHNPSLLKQSKVS